MIPNPPIVRPGHGPKIDAPVIGFQGLDEFGAVVQQAVLQVDRRQGRGQLPQVPGRCADQRRQLAETPMGGGHRIGATGGDQGQGFHIVAGRFDADLIATHGPNVSAVRAGTGGGVKVVEVQKAFVIGPGKPFRGYAADALAARHVHAVGTGSGRIRWV